MRQSVGQPANILGHVPFVVDDIDAAVATGHAGRIRPVCHGFIDERGEVLVRADEGVDPSLAPSRPASPALFCRRPTEVPGGLLRLEVVEIEI